MANFMTDNLLAKRNHQAPVLNPNGVKVPPHSIDAERSVLGGLMLDNRAWDQIIDRLRDEDFYRHEHRLIFRIMLGLVEKNKPMDVLTIAEALRERQELEQVGGEIYLFEMANNTPSAANIVAYADIERERAVLRKMIAAASGIAESAFNSQGRSIIELLDNAERSVFAIADHGSSGSGPLNIKEYLAKTMDRIDTLFHSNNAITGVPTGYNDFDEMTSGLQGS